MAPTEGRVARPEWQWDCHRSTPVPHANHPLKIIKITLHLFTSNNIMEMFEISKIPTPDPGYIRSGSKVNQLQW